MIPAILEALAAAAAARRPAVLATRLPDGLQRLLVERDGQFGFTPEGLPPLPSPACERMVEAAADAAMRDRSAVVVLEGADWFLHVHAPPPRLLVVGAVHIAQALAPLASATGFAVSVIDPRESFATEARFPGIELVTLWPDDALRALAVDRHTAIVTLTHDPKLDDPALETALAGPAFYVGALGSRKTQAARRARLRECGLPEAAVDRLRGPVGLAIGAIGAPEIAVSILAEIVAVRRGSRLAERSG